MRYRINQIKLDIDSSHSDLAGAIKKKLRKKHIEIKDIKIVRESIDARKKPEIKLVYTLDFSCDERLQLSEAKELDYDKKMGMEIERAYRRNSRLIDDGSILRPVVVGFGPCGMFAALILAEAGMKPIIIERGREVDRRIEDVRAYWNGGKLNPESNVQFGEGGAGTFSDGKLTTGIKDIRISKVLHELVEAGADKSILYKHKPHIGTDMLVNIVKNIRKKIEDLGGEVRFETRLTDIIFDRDGKGEIEAIITNHGKIKADKVILAIGHSARDTFEMLYSKNIKMEQKPFSIGVRIEHPQKMIDEAQYGSSELSDLLGAADYKLNYRCESGRGVYTFCMCPGGRVIDASSEEGGLVTNGMSNSERNSGIANSGLLVDVHRDDFESNHPLAGVEFQRKYEKLAYELGEGRLPRTSYGNFKSNERNCVRLSLPEFAVESIIEAMPNLGKKLKGFDDENSILTAVETRSSSPVRILRDESYQASVVGLYPAGEGPGYAGGIMSAAVDGIRIAEKIFV